MEFRKMTKCSWAAGADQSCMLEHGSYSSALRSAELTKGTDPLTQFDNKHQAQPYDFSGGRVFS